IEWGSQLLEHLCFAASDPIKNQCRRGEHLNQDPHAIDLFHRTTDVFVVLSAAVPDFGLGSLGLGLKGIVQGGSILIDSLSG
ncbi:MAG: hypothetical protein WA822_18535, partial [Albidovulum sp.]